MKSTFNDIFKILKKNIYYFFFFLNILENNFYMVIKRASNGKALYSTCMQHDMPQSLLVFAASFTQETLNFGTFVGFAHPP